jgi:hypothetical protein
VFEEAREDLYRDGLAASDYGAGSSILIDDGYARDLGGLVAMPKGCG